MRLPWVPNGAVLAYVGPAATNPLFLARPLPPGLIPLEQRAYYELLPLLEGLRPQDLLPEGEFEPEPITPPSPPLPRRAHRASPRQLALF